MDLMHEDGRRLQDVTAPEVMGMTSGDADLQPRLGRRWAAMFGCGCRLAA
jgi:hypothetical protein